jgi:nitrogen-specific signal transduction histidine kinase
VRTHLTKPKSSDRVNILKFDEGVALDLQDGPQRRARSQLTEDDERIYVTILDNGPGITASVQRTLFDPYVTAGKSNGTGLGLTLALRIAEEHGGSVCLEESNPKGTVFTLTLTKNRSLVLEDLTVVAPTLSDETRDSYAAISGERQSALR